MSFPEEDRAIVRKLAARVMEIASLPVQAEKRDMWIRHNRLSQDRPMVWINEEPWPEMQCEELTSVSQDMFCRGVEDNLRRTIYLWEHMAADRVIDGFFAVSLVHHDAGYGIDQGEVRTRPGIAGQGSADYTPIMKTEEDVERICMPEITPDWDATDRNYARVSELIGDIIPVEKHGIVHIWGAPWDVLIRWWGIEELMVDMIDRPELVTAGITRMMDALLSRLDQFEAEGLLDVTDGNHRVGSGGLGITDELPSEGFDAEHVRPIDQWGTSTGQIFSEVSPDMHWEFCLKHEMRWLERFGLNCYGCCEPLHNKMEILKRVPRLHRISMSTWVDVDKAAERLGGDYVFSYKPNPAIFAWDEWNPDAAREELRSVLDRTRGCQVELIVKDVSTCRNDPRRIWEWCDLAVKVAEEYA